MSGLLFPCAVGIGNVGRVSTPRTPASTPRTPDADWWRDAVVYQVYPRSFADANGDGLGDIAGSPRACRTSRRSASTPCGSRRSSRRRSPTAGTTSPTNRAVDPRLGTLDDFDAFLRAAHEHDLRVIVDIVPNHTSDQHEWFRAALAAAPGSPERARYVFREGAGESGELPPSDWVSNFGGSAWTRVPDGQWYLHLFAPEQPDLDWSNPEVRRDFEETLRFWADRGVDGFRVDVAHGLAKDLSEPYRASNEQALPLDGSDPLYDRDEVHEIFEGWRHVLDEYDPPRARRRRGVGAGTASCALRASHGTRAGVQLRPPRVALRRGGLPRGHPAEPRGVEQSGASSTWVLSNHDVVRHATRYGLPDGTDTDAWLMTDGTTPVLDRERGLRRARAATVLLLALPGFDVRLPG